MGLTDKNRRWTCGWYGMMQMCAQLIQYRILVDMFLVQLIVIVARRSARDICDSDWIS